jgi:hypothetical protein
MPNRRGMLVEPAELEQANPFPPGRFSEPEPQERRGLPGSRGRGDPVPARPRSGGPKDTTDRWGPTSWTGVNPLPPIDPAMPLLKPGDQAG